MNWTKIPNVLCRVYIASAHFLKSNILGTTFAQGIHRERLQKFFKGEYRAKSQPKALGPSMFSAIY